jgi:HSP90 family molecular chaperone
MHLVEITEEGADVMIMINNPPAMKEVVEVRKYVEEDVMMIGEDPNVNHGIETEKIDPRTAEDLTAVPQAEMIDHVTKARIERREEAQVAALAPSKDSAENSIQKTLREEEEKESVKSKTADHM